MFTHPGPELTEAEFHEWYEEEHIPARTALKGFQSTIRLEAFDGEIPHWGAIYDLDSLDVLQSEGYLDIMKNRSERETSVLKRIVPFDRRIYKQISSRWHPAIGTSEELTPRYYVMVGLKFKPEDEAEMHQWYEEEHVDMLSRIPGWIRSRRFELVDQKGTAGDNVCPKFMALHEYRNETDLTSPERKAAQSTPWRTRVIGNAVEVERRTFKVYKVFK